MIHAIGLARAEASYKPSKENYERLPKIICREDHFCPKNLERAQYWVANQREAAYKQAKNQLDDTRKSGPLFNGQIPGFLRCHAGQIGRSRRAVAFGGQPLKPYVVTVNLSDSYISQKPRIGQTATISLSSFPGEAFYRKDRSNRSRGR